MSEATQPPREKTTQAADFVALSRGRTIGRYTIVAVLGQGGFGITYRARASQLGREVAIKEYLPLALAVRQEGATVLPRSTAAAADFAWGRDRFVAEGRTLASLQDAPGIVRVFDFLEANGTAYIVMQLVQSAGFARGLLVGLYAGLAVRAGDRPQSIAGWRAILAQAAAPDTAATMPPARGTKTGAAPIQRPTRRRAGAAVGGNAAAAGRDDAGRARGSISRTGPERNGGGRICQISLTR